MRPILYYLGRSRDCVRHENHNTIIIMPALTQANVLSQELHQALIQVFSQFDERKLDGHDQFDARTLDVRELPHLMQLDKEQQQALAQALLASASKA